MTDSDVGLAFSASYTPTHQRHTTALPIFVLPVVHTQIHTHTHNTLTPPKPQQLQDEDVVQVVGKTVTQQKHSKDYAKKVQAHWDQIKAKRDKKPLKS